MPTNFGQAQSADGTHTGTYRKELRKAAAIAGSIAVLLTILFSIGKLSSPHERARPPIGHGTSEARMNTCDDAAANIAFKIGATLGRRMPGEMVEVRHPQGGEITFGCPGRKSGGFLALFAKSGDPEGLLPFVASTGEALTGHPQTHLIKAATDCLRAAWLDPSGYARRQLDELVTLDCGGGQLGANPKVTYEFLDR